MLPGHSIRLHARQQLRRKRKIVYAELRSVLHSQIRGDGRQIINSISEWRHCDRHHRQKVKQITPKAPFFNLAPKVPRAGAYDAGWTAPLLIRRVIVVAGEQIRQMRLEVRGKIADLVKEHRG